LLAIRQRGQRVAGYNPTLTWTLTPTEPAVYRRDSCYRRSSLWLGHREIDYGGELTLAVTGHGDRFDEWLELHPDVRPVLSLVAHLQGTTLEKLTTGTESVRYQPPKSVVLGLDPDPMTTQTSLVNSAN